MSRIKDALIIDQQTEEPPEDEGLFEPGGAVWSGWNDEDWY
jgi:hypothetical protein